MSRTQFEIYFLYSFSASLFVPHSPLSLSLFLCPFPLKAFIFVSRFPDIFPTHVRARAWNTFYCEIVINDERENLFLCARREASELFAHVRVVM